MGLIGKTHSVPSADDSGYWGRGGLFTALEVRSDQPRKQYELAGEMKGGGSRLQATETQNVLY